MVDVIYSIDEINTKPNLILPVSNKPAKAPYAFAVTGINVYSFEEALYHVYHNWRESSEDFTSSEFISWLENDAGLYDLAEKTRRIAAMNSYTDSVITFLRLTDYFSDEDIESVKADISNWEREFEWENLKLRADFLLEQNIPERAVILYKRANELYNSPDLLNNTGIAFMKLYKFETAVSYFEAAIEFDYYNDNIMLNLAEAAVYAHDYDKAAEMLSMAERLRGNSPLISYLYGEMAFEKGNLIEAEERFLTAIDLAGKHENAEAGWHIACRLADVYVKRFAFEKALNALVEFKGNKRFYVKHAEVAAASYKLPVAVNAMEQAIKLDNSDFSLYIYLAKYCRLSNDSLKARAAIEKAVSLAPDNPLVKLEYARISKMEGGLSNYLSTLHEILADFKQEYRETSEL